MDGTGPTERDRPTPGRFSLSTSIGRQKSRASRAPERGRPRCPPSARLRCCRVTLLRGLDQRLRFVLAPVAGQLNRVRLAVDDSLEELLAVLVGGERRLGPAPGLVEDH